MTAASSLWWTEPVGGPPGQRAFRNAVVTWLPAAPWRTPALALGALLAVERALGRVRAERWGPRVIDLDLLAWDGIRDPSARAGRSPQPTLPHPRARERAFVLVPWAEVVPAWRHPLDGRSLADLAGAVGHVGLRAASAAERRAWDAATGVQRGPR